MKRITIVACVVAGFLFGAAFSAYGQPASPPPNAVQGLAVTLAVTAVSARVQLPSSIATFPVVLIINNGLKDAFVTFGTVAVNAVVTNIPVPAGHALALQTTGTGTYLAAICAGTDTTSLYVVQFNGQPFYR